jgi:hypothetical protein
MDTKHLHWYYSPASPYEVQLLHHNNLYPAACASANIDLDQEVLLVSKWWSGGSYVYWSMEPED